jgi:hypothetical protein
MEASGRMEVQLHNSWPRYQMEVNGQFHAPAALTPWIQPPVPIGQALDEPQSLPRLYVEDKVLLPLPGIESPSFIP